jgi:hypothetical protein
MMSIPTLVCFAEWAFFILYWNAAAKNSSPAKVSESRKSRRVHEILLNAGLLLVIVPVPGLRERFLPDKELIEWIGLILETAAFALGIWSGEFSGPIGAARSRSRSIMN